MGNLEHFLEEVKLLFEDCINEIKLKFDIFCYCTNSEEIEKKISKYEDLSKTEETIKINMFFLEYLIHYFSYRENDLTEIEEKFKEVIKSTSKRKLVREKVIETIQELVFLLFAIKTKEKELRTKNKGEQREKISSFAERKLNTCIEILKNKNADYAGNEDPLKNFLLVEKHKICKVEQGILTRTSDKLSRIITITKSKKINVKSESLEDTILDFINYLFILYYYTTFYKQSIFGKMISNFKNNWRKLWTNF